MTPEAQRIAIAGACGFTLRETVEIDGIKFHYWFHKDGSQYDKGDIPDYLNDLNAMHEAEKMLFHPYTETGDRCYETSLCKILFPNSHINEIGSYSGEIAAIAHAPAAQRAEAFLRTLGKWTND